VHNLNNLKTISAFIFYSFLMQNEGMKRNFEELTSDLTKKAKTEIGLDALATATVATSESELKRHVIPKARENRLEQNRKAARESRRRKKLMIEGEEFTSVPCCY
jgi:hypothetical protein